MSAKVHVHIVCGEFHPFCFIASDIFCDLPSQSDTDSVVSVVHCYRARVSFYAFKSYLLVYIENYQKLINDASAVMLDSWCFKPSQPQRIIASGLRETSFGKEIFS